jgi:hypothetical protein
MATISEADFAVLAAQTRLPMDAATQRELHGAYEKLAGMFELVGGPRAREVEPALIFLPGAAP